MRGESSNLSTSEQPVSIVNGTIDPASVNCGFGQTGHSLASNPQLLVEESHGCKSVPAQRGRVDVQFIE
ncbi:hypothetical protein BLNAU_4822 [Blattamonas nauphoetae]|uniref:Uncharacterized protein n=1 Tax=Blattamonas nauphoetae TaxID=2049346 RepID=A0ABQ9Y9A5_9EUKA|nr:hypothetical protein BLNAU_4822 [Blattamonas nauphoetae]